MVHASMAPPLTSARAAREALSCACAAGILLRAGPGRPLRFPGDESLGFLLAVAVYALEGEYIYLRLREAAANDGEPAEVAA